MKITEEDILRMAKSKGFFCVSWRYRDDWLRNKCKKLVLAGKLKWGRYEAGRDMFLPIN